MKTVINPQYPAARDFISTLPLSFEEKGELLHQGRNTVKLFHTPSGDRVVKRYKRPNLIQRIAYTFFKKSKAERAYLYSHELLSRGIRTPEGIAYIEQKRGGLIDGCYFVSTACSDRSLLPVLVKVPDYDRQLADSLTAFLVELHTKGFLHGDLNLNNILYRKEPDGTFTFTVIDTNRSTFCHAPTPRQCLENLKRVTHRRDLLQYMVEKYAALRGWDIRQSVQQVMAALDKFERQRKLKELVKFKKA